MVYTPEEKQRMDGLMEAFGDYLASNMDVDVLYSEKAGYVRLIVEECADPLFFRITDFDDMLEMFFHDILSEEVTLAMDQNPDLTNGTMNYRTPYARLKAIVDTLEADREYALMKLDRFIEKWKNSELLP